MRIMTRTSCKETKQIEDKKLMVSKIINWTYICSSPFG